MEKKLRNKSYTEMLSCDKNVLFMLHNCLEVIFCLKDSKVNLL